MLYCHAILPKAGLGNRLFPWARCRVFSFKNNAAMLHPTWAQLRIGPLLRRESDLRLYTDLFKAGPDELTSMTRLFVKLSSRWEHEDDEIREFAGNSNGKSVIKVFTGERDRFRQLNGWHEFLNAQLHAITKPKWRDAVKQIKHVPIGMHVRMGDFVVADSDPDNPHQRVAHSWYLQCLRAIRAAAGHPVPAIMVSDGREDELEDLLAEENVSLVRTGSAISDLLVLARSEVLVASAGSSFSAWAAFLGQMPSIAHPSRGFDWFNLRTEKNCYVGGFDPVDPPESFLRQVETIFGRSTGKQTTPRRQKFSFSEVEASK